MYESISVLFLGYCITINIECLQAACIVNMHSKNIPYGHCFTHIFARNIIILRHWNIYTKNSFDLWPPIPWHMNIAYDTYLSVALQREMFLTNAHWTYATRMSRHSADSSLWSTSAAHFLEYAWEKHSLKNQFFPIEKVLALHINFQ